MADSLRVLFNPNCSKCRTVRRMLDERNLEVTYVHYLDERLSSEEIVATMRKLGIPSPLAMMRTNEPLYRELALADADDDRVLSAMVAHPILVERPIVIRGDRAVIARPPEKVLELLDADARDA